ncbi:energy-coupling factor ABC transporter permease [Clostridium sediminicola]|uniref:energy-coupling factor ABC transporter permease n=1 Tax=Clostridium sediminicola TaxID=3114879 RepID=UPI0031F24C10
MHMVDALVSPVVSGTMFVATAGITTYSVKKVQSELDDKKIPLMGVMGAFIFASQMINFTIPGTGSSGHIAGGLLLAILLGPYAGFITMASVLLIQALFFADGGLLAYGANVFNLGFYACFIVYPLIYKKFIEKGYSNKRIFSGAIISSVIALQLGALSVVLQTLFSGKTELPFVSFLILMQPIHLAIGIIEGVVTASVVSFVWKARPEILEKSALGQSLEEVSIRRISLALLICTLIIGGGLSWFASSNPDGLEWSVAKHVEIDELQGEGEIYSKASNIQEKTAFLPDYGFKFFGSEETQIENKEQTDAWPKVSAGTSISGILGGTITLLLAMVTGGVIVFFKRRRKQPA